MGLLLACLSAANADEPTRIGVRVGNHSGFGRVVFDVPHGTQYRLTRDGNRIILRFDPEAPVATGAAAPRNVLSVQGGEHAATVELARNAGMHAMRLGDHVVIDALDPDPAAAAPAMEPKAAAEPVKGATHPEGTGEGGKSGKLPLLSRGDDRATGRTSNSRTIGHSPQPSPGRGGEGASTAPPAASAATVSGPPQRAGEDEEHAGLPVSPHDAGAGSPRHGAVSATPGGLATLGKGTPHPSSRPGAAPPVQAADPAPQTIPAVPIGQLAIATSAAPARPQDLATDRWTSPLGLTVTLLPVPRDGPGAAFEVPFPPGVGAAAFRRGDSDYVVFDTPRPLDLAALRHDKLLGGAQVQVLPEATLVRLRLPPALGLSLSQTAGGWTVRARPEVPRPRPIGQHFSGGKFQLAAHASARVVTMSDLETGATLLVGTQRQAGEAVDVRRSTPEFALLPSWQGVLVEALSDRLVLRAGSDGFVLSAEPGALSVSPLTDDALTDAAALTRRFDFSALPVALLRQHIVAGLDRIAAAPALSRGPLREAVARDMIALGMAAEAEALLHVAMQEDPKEAASPDANALASVAALLAERPAEAEAIDDPRLTGSDEVVFWRAVRRALSDDSSARAAAAFAVTGALALDYPAALRDQLLPLVAETMLRGGQADAARALLAKCGDQPGLALARAMAKEDSGEVEAALAAYDALAQDPDRMVSAHAAVRAIELRLRLGRMSVQRAAEGLDRLLYAWRGDRHDLAVRERLAALRQESDAWRAALTILRDAERDFPEAKADIHPRLVATFAALLRDGAADRLPPLELVTLAQENADLLSASADGEALQAKLADRLLALDLPNQAGPVLETLMRAAPTPVGRAGFGARLAALRLREGDAPGALGALLTSAAAQLPTDLAERRRLLFADATARRGDFTAALAALAGLDSATAASARADIMEQAQDWQGADRALADYVARTVPDAGELNEAQRRVLLRLATAAARAGDDALLNRLHAHEAVRMGSGPLADMFRLLTAPPVRGTGDLQRSRGEVGLARALPAALRAVQPASAMP